ncbi:MAG: hypothetical protein AAF747_04285 [Planctomycetota bacterium]
MNRNRFAATLIAAVPAVAAAQSADFTFGWTDLDGTFVLGNAPGDGLFTATSTFGSAIASDGNFSRLTGAAGNAEFNSGFESGRANPSYALQLEVSSFGGMTTGVGSLEILDQDGDSFTADINGIWSFNFGFLFFNAELTDAVFTAAPGSDGNFDGVSSGSFQFDDVGTLEGAFSILLRPGSAGFFSDDFSVRSTQSDALIIPTPASTLLAGLGIGLVTFNRRR